MSGESARVESIEELAASLLEEEEIGEDAIVNVGYPVNGHVYLCRHECPVCHSSMETVGTGHGEYFCSWCEAQRNQKIKMKRGFEHLEKIS